MIGSVALDVAIGLVFIFLLYSLLASIIAEMIAAFFGLRARTLHKGIERMLEEEKEGFIKGKWPLIFNGLRDTINDFHESFSRYFRDSDCDATEKFYDYPLVKYLGRDKYFSKPSYISRQTFSKVLIDLIKKGQNGSDIAKIKEGIETLKNEEEIILQHKEVLKKESDVGVVNKTIEIIRDHIQKSESIANPGPSFEKKLLSFSSKPKKIQKLVEQNYKGNFIKGETLELVESFLDDANDDIEKFKILLENWFDATVQRTIGWYKRRTQLNLLVIGFFIACFFNASTIEIANKLSKDDDAREQMVRLATTYVKENPDIIQNIEKLAKDSILNDTARTDVKILEAKLDSLLNMKEKLNEDISKANDILGFILPDSIVAKRIVERPLDSAKRAILTSMRLTLNSKPKQRLIDSIYSVEFSNAYLAEHAASFYSPKKKIGRWKFWKEKDTVEKEQKAYYVYKNKSGYFWNQFWGYLLTALAISLGAAFWFDLLNKFIKLRSSSQEQEYNMNKSNIKKGDVPLDKRVG